MANIYVAQYCDRVSFDAELDDPDPFWDLMASPQVDSASLELTPEWIISVQQKALQDFVGVYLDAQGKGEEDEEDRAPVLTWLMVTACTDPGEGRRPHWQYHAKDSDGDLYIILVIQQVTAWTKEAV